MKNFRKKFNKFSLDEVIKTSKFDYCKNLKWFLIAPLLLIITGIVLFFTVGFNLGLDFTGGSVMTIYANNGGEILSEDNATPVKEYDFKKAGNYEEFKNQIEKILRAEGVSGNLVFQSTQMDIEEIDVYSGDAVIVKYQNKDGASVSEISEFNAALKQALLDGLSYGASEYYVGAVANGGVITASASSELLMNAFLAMLVAIVLILIYIIFRFELTSGLAAIFALFHDLLIVTSLVLICRITINSSFIAALVTILGYSINNTIIIFDRIRENIKSGKFEKAENSLVANVSVNETMSRSIYTTLTTFVTILLVAIIGVSDIRDFALPIVFGILAGFYSSVFITPGLWAIAYRPSKRRLKKQQSKQNPA